jgi:hypothetical protein
MKKKCSLVNVTTQVKIKDIINEKILHSPVLSVYLHWPNPLV